MSATMIINPNAMSTIDVTVGDANKYDNAVQIKIARNFGNGRIHGTDELFLTPIQMELLGRFLVRQADELRSAQAFKEVA